MDIEKFVSRLEGVQRTSRGYKARCPAHHDKSPSLCIGKGEDRILVHCFALCATKDIVKAMGLTMADLFFGAHSRYEQNSVGSQRLELADVAFRFELGALDRRLRAERVLTAAKHFHPDEMNDHQLERTLNAIARAYADQERAKCLETVADRIRTKSYQERTTRYAA